MSTPPLPQTTLADRGRIPPPQWPAGAALAGLCSITLAFYHGLWVPGLVLIKRDAFWFYLPLKHYLIERLSAGELPQWFPYEAFGRPFIGATHTGAFHPFTALYFLLPVPDAYRAATLISCLLATLGAFMLGRMLKLSRAGSLVAGVAFTLSGYVVSLTDNIVYLYSICVLPFFCASLEKVLREGRTWVAAPAVIWATVFLNGDIQTGYYYGFIALLWMGARAPEPYREAVLKLALAAGLAALLAGIQLGPSAAVFGDSNRTQPLLFQEQALRWSTHPLRLLALIASPIAADADPYEVGRFFWGNSQFGVWAESLYLGVPVIGLAFLGAWQRRDLRVIALLGVIALVLALGRYGGLYQVFSQLVPLWSVFRYPEKLMGVVAFAASMLAGAGLDALRAGQRPPAPWFAVAALCAAAGFCLKTEALGELATASFSAPSTLARTVTSSAALAFFYSAFVALGTGLVVAGARRAGIREGILSSSLIVLVTVDLVRANLGAYHTAPNADATFTPPFAEALKAREGPLVPGRFRLLTINERTVVLPARVQQKLGYEGAWSLQRRQALDLAHNSLFHLESIYAYLPGYSATLAVALRQQVGMELAARFNVRYFIGRQYWLQNPRLSETLVAALDDYDLALLSNPIPPKPRVYLSRRPEGTASAVDPTIVLARPDFLNGDVDVIETTDATLPGPALSGSALVEHYAPEEVRVRTETPQPAVLVLLDAFDQGWTATLENGTVLPILRANVLVRAVVVPAGIHTASIRYETPLLRAGAAASLVGMLICLGMIGHARWRRRATLSAP